MEHDTQTRAWDWAVWSNDSIRLQFFIEQTGWELLPFILLEISFTSQKREITNIYEKI